MTETQVDSSHRDASTVEHLAIHNEQRSRKSSTISSPTSPDNWLSYYSRHYSLPDGSTQPAAIHTAVGRHDLWATTEDGEDDDAVSTFRSDGSTPEPPLSARPKNLVNHPKILKDKLHRSMSAVGRTHDVNFLNRSWSFANR